MSRFQRRDAQDPADGIGWRPKGLAARAGVWSARHRKLAIWGWLAFVFLAFAIGAAVGTKALDNSDTGVGESGRADSTLRAAAPKHADEMVLVQSDSAPGHRPVVPRHGRRRPAPACGRAPHTGNREPLRAGEPREDLE